MDDVWIYLSPIITITILVIIHLIKYLHIISVLKNEVQLPHHHSAYHCSQIFHHSLIHFFHQTGQFEIPEFSLRFPNPSFSNCFIPFPVHKKLSLKCTVYFKYKLKMLKYCLFYKIILIPTPFMGSSLPVSIVNLLVMPMYFFLTFFQ